MIEWDDHGILCREYLPDEETFDPTQLKIINHGLYVTDDNWLTSKAGIGRFKLWNPLTQTDEERYGVIADTISAHIIFSDEIYAANADNTFRVDNNGLSVANETNSINLNPSAESLINVTHEGTPILYLNEDGDLSITGIITSYGGIIGGWTIGEDAIYHGTDSPTSTEVGLYLGTSAIRGYTDESHYFTFSNGTISATGADIAGTLTTDNLSATGGTIGGANGWHITTNAIYNGCNSMSSTTAGTYVGTAGIRNYSTSTKYVNISGGVLTAYGASISGSITATSGYIGGTSGWNITSNAIYNGCNSMSSTTAGTYIGTNGIRNYASANAYVNIQNGTLTTNNAIINGGKINIQSSSASNDILYLKGPNAQMYLDTENLFVGTNNNRYQNWINYQGSGLRANQELLSEYAVNYYSSDNEWESAMRFYQYSGRGLGYTGYYGINLWANPSEGGQIRVFAKGNTTQASIGLNGNGRAIGMFNSSNTLTIQLLGSNGNISCVSLTQTSDRNAKRDIVPLNKEQSARFIYAQNPVSFYYEDFDNSLHHGIVAQEEEEIISQIYGNDQWGLVQVPDDNGEEMRNRYKSIAYTEFIPDIIATLQTINERLTTLEQKVG